MRTRKQLLMKSALVRVNQVKAEEGKKVASAYGGLCHKLPVLIRNHGLAQTCAWIETKASGDQTKPLPRAYAILREHVAGTLGTDEANLLSAILDANLQIYMQQTYTLMDAWIYHKRFAVSILGAKDATYADEDAVDEPTEVAS